MRAVDERVQAILGEYVAPGVGAAWALCDRHDAGKVAFTVIGEGGDATDLTYGELATASERAAAALAALGVGPGDRVATLMGKGPALVATMLAAWRLGAVYVPLFTAFGPQAIAMRLTDTNAKVVVTDPDQAPKLAPGDDIPAEASWQVVLAEELDRGGSAEVRPAYAGGGDWPLVHMLTSGTTGRPKGVVHPLAYVADWHVYLEFGLGVCPDDVYWCAADPGWAYGLYTGIIAPLAMGIRSHLVAGGFSPAATMEILSGRGITNFTAAPTAYRSLRALELDEHPPVQLRRASSAGEPLTPEVNEWAADALGVVVRDHYGQTEVGMCIGNHHQADVCRPIKPGSMGQALPGWSVAVLRDDADEEALPDALGRIAIDTHASPLMTFRGYQSDTHTAGKFTPDGRWYLTGDAGRCDEEGDIFFSARDDDVIIMAGYRIGPFDVESVLAQHDAVAECAIIAVPDPVRGEVIEAFVVTRGGYEPSEALAEELQRLVKERYAAYAYPRTVHFAESLPKTPSGKIQRFVLRERRVAGLTPATGR